MPPPRPTGTSLLLERIQQVLKYPEPRLRFHDLRLERLGKDVEPLGCCEGDALVRVGVRVDRHCAAAQRRRGHREFGHGRVAEKFENLKDGQRVVRVFNHWFEGVSAENTAAEWLWRDADDLGVGEQLPVEHDVVVETIDDRPQRLPGLVGDVEHDLLVRGVGPRPSDPRAIGLGFREQADDAGGELIRVAEDEELLDFSALSDGCVGPASFIKACRHNLGGETGLSRQDGQTGRQTDRQTSS